LNEDLNAQMLTRCINEGKTLVKDTKEMSLATELEHLTKEEVWHTFSLAYTWSY
jgi:predicted metalloprotease